MHFKAYAPTGGLIAIDYNPEKESFIINGKKIDPVTAKSLFSMFNGSNRKKAISAIAKNFNFVKAAAASKKNFLHPSFVILGMESSLTNLSGNLYMKTIELLNKKGGVVTDSYSETFMWKESFIFLGSVILMMASKEISYGYPMDVVLFSLGGFGIDLSLVSIENKFSIDCGNKEGGSVEKSPGFIALAEAESGFTPRMKNNEKEISPTEETYQLFSQLPFFLSLDTTPSDKDEKFDIVKNDRKERSHARLSPISFVSQEQQQIMKDEETTTLSTPVVMISANSNKSSSMRETFLNVFSKARDLLPALLPIPEFPFFSSQPKISLESRRVSEQSRALDDGLDREIEEQGKISTALATQLSDISTIQYQQRCQLEQKNRELAELKLKYQTLLLAGQSGNSQEESSSDSGQTLWEDIESRQKTLPLLSSKPKLQMSQPPIGADFSSSNPSFFGQNTPRTEKQEMRDRRRNNEAAEAILEESKQSRKEMEQVIEGAAQKIKFHHI